ncbi:MAG: sel1 repeat family protein [Alphaproteobacteria bacterium]|nr:sel1 repeat family protein [Alphaproteobacteria bacterium]
MMHTLKTIGFSFAILALSSAGMVSARAAEATPIKLEYIKSMAPPDKAVENADKVGILPPDLDYAKICIPQKSLEVDTFDWRGKTPATSGLSQEKLAALAELYFKGSGKTPPDYQRTVEIVDYLSKQSGQYANAALFIKYDFLKRDIWPLASTETAEDVLKRLLSSNDPTAYSLYGDLYVQEGNYIKAVEYYKNAFMRGDASSVMSLAYLYHDKKIPATEEEVNKAIIQAQDAAMQYLIRGNCHALTLFGMMYMRLNNIPNSELLGAKWFEKAALLDEEAPKLELARVLQRGFVIKNDEVLVLRLWKEAADLGSSRAMFLLGEHALTTQKTDEKLNEAVRWFEKSAQWGNAKAMALLADFYDGLYPRIKDPEKQRYWLEVAVKDPEAKARSFIKLASLYEQDKTVPRSTIFALYQQAALKGSFQGYIKLGDAYRYGIGTPENPIKALRYYRHAADSGRSSAMRMLKKAYECRIGVPYNKE